MDNKIDQRKSPLLSSESLVAFLYKSFMFPNFVSLQIHFSYIEQLY